MFYRLHSKAEQRALLLVLFILVTISFGGLVEIVPLFTIESTIERVEGVRPYSPLELAGRNVYVREGCYTCHSQMIRPFRDEVERYGHYSLAAESMYDHPFQWGSKRTGPDLARVGGRYSDEWHVAHLVDPRSLVPESVMPAYPFLAAKRLDGADMPTTCAPTAPWACPTRTRWSSGRGRPARPGRPEGDHEALLARYPKAAVGDLDGRPHELTEMDALVAYLQILGRMVDFTDVKTDDLRQ
jgi:cytochrome c oxidase cbb3-type subunit 2